MAKIKPGIIELSGKFEDKVHVHNKYGGHVRKTSPVKSKKRLAALGVQNQRTKMLNDLAGGINSIFAIYARDFKDRNFYQHLLSRFRNEPENNRFLLLRQLKSIQVNGRYPLDSQSCLGLTVSPVKDKIRVRLTVTHHPHKAKLKTDCYCYDVILLCWTKNNMRPAHSMQTSEWIYVHDDLPEFDFYFSGRKDTVHWLLCVRQQWGLKERVIDVFNAQGMQLVEAGTFDRKDLALLKKREQHMAALAETAAKKSEKPEVRVKARLKRAQ